MKNLVFGLIATVMFGFVGNAQSNNPYNKAGADMVNSAHELYKEYVAGKFKNITQETLDSYSYLFPDKSKISLANFNSILNTMKVSTNKSIIDNSGFSSEGKSFLEKSTTNGSISALVDEVNKSKIIDTEKKSILTILAMNYNMIYPSTVVKTTVINGGKGPNVNFDVFETESFDFKSTCNNLKLLSNGNNTWTAGFLGAIIGTVIGGPVGFFIGGGIGVIFGAIADNNHWFVNYPSSNTNGNTSGNNTTGNNPLPPKPRLGGWDPLP